MTTSPEPVAAAPVAPDDPKRSPGPNLRALLAAAAQGGDRLLDPQAVEAVLGPVPAIGDAGRRMLVDGLAEVAEDLLEVDVAAAAAKGWLIHERLVQAARASRATPGLTEIVDLGSHDVRSVWRPTIEVLVGATRVARIDVEVCVTLRMVGVFAAVTGGCLRRIGGARCDVTGRLVMSGRTLLERTVPVPAEAFAVAVGRGIELVPCVPPLSATARTGNGTGARS